jgi:hypothetical protein
MVQIQNLEEFVRIVAEKLSGQNLDFYKKILAYGVCAMRHIATIIKAIQDYTVSIKT